MSLHRFFFRTDAPILISDRLKKSGVSIVHCESGWRRTRILEAVG